MKCLTDTPLCPAGHLPLKGGDRLVATRRSNWTTKAVFAFLPRILFSEQVTVLPISPLEGEMPGRAEGGISFQLPSCAIAKA
jgi:fused signal recognition particle receptor